MYWSLPAAFGHQKTKEGWCLNPHQFAASNTNSCVTELDKFRAVSDRVSQSFSTSEDS